MKRRQEAAEYRQRLVNIRRLVEDCARLQKAAVAELDDDDDDPGEEGISALRADHARLRCLRAHRAYIATWLQGRRILYVRNFSGCDFCIAMIE